MPWWKQNLWLLVLICGTNSICLLWLFPWVLWPNKSETPEGSTVSHWAAQQARYRVLDSTSPSNRSTPCSTTHEMTRVLCSTWILVWQTGSHALTNTKSRVPCSTADLDLANSKRDRFRLKGIAPLGARQTTSLMSSFGFNALSNNKSHVPPFTRRHVANVEKKGIHTKFGGCFTIPHVYLSEAFFSC